MRAAAILMIIMLSGTNFALNINQRLESYLSEGNVKRAEINVKSVKTVQKHDLGMPETDAKAFYAYNADTNTVLAAKDEDERLQIASLTKLMTAYVFLSAKPNLDEVVTIPNFSLQPGDAVAGLVAGDRITKRDLLAAMLINSGSDAAQSIAILNAGSVDKFVYKMNASAENLGLSNTHFANPVGWDDASNYSSAKDITNLARTLLNNPTFSEIVSTKNKTIFTETGRPILLTNTNSLLGQNGFMGVKTGFTYGANGCLVSLNSNSGSPILLAVVGSNDRFYTTDALISWTKQAFSW